MNNTNPNPHPDRICAGCKWWQQNLGGGHSFGFCRWCPPGIEFRAAEISAISWCAQWEECEPHQVRLAIKRNGAILEFFFVRGTEISQSFGSKTEADETEGLGHLEWRPMERS